MLKHFFARYTMAKWILIGPIVGLMFGLILPMSPLTIIPYGIAELGRRGKHRGLHSNWRGERGVR